MNWDNTIWTMSGSEIVNSQGFAHVGGTVLLFLGAMLFVALVFGVDR